MMRRRFSAAALACLLVAAMPLAHAEADPPAMGFSAAALYNSANTYARAGKPGLAVLNYQRASLLDPTDEDIRANLRFVQTAAGLAPAPDTRWDAFARLARPEVFAWLGLAGVLLAGSGVLGRRLAPRNRRAASVAVVFGIAMIGAAAADALALWPAIEAGVVIAGAAPVRASPVPMGDQLFTLREAETVTRLAHHDSYVLIRTRAGRQGWISADSLAPVIPLTDAAPTPAPPRS